MENITDEMEKIKEGARLFKALSHPIRLCIVKGLIKEEGCNVSKIQNCLDIPQSTLSQHLIKLKDMGILRGERDGLNVNYYVINEKARRVIEILFDYE